MLDAYGRLWRGVAESPATSKRVYQTYQHVDTTPPFEPRWAYGADIRPEAVDMPSEYALGRVNAERAIAAIRWHYQQWISGDDKCWQDNEELYSLLPEGYNPPARDTLVMLENCVKYVASCHRPGTEYVSPQRRIEELEAALKTLLQTSNGYAKQLNFSDGRQRTIYATPEEYLTRLREINGNTKPEMS
jgi:hypothetical protein